LALVFGSDTAARQPSFPRCLDDEMKGALAWSKGADAGWAKGGGKAWGGSKGDDWGAAAGGDAWGGKGGAASWGAKGGDQWGKGGDQWGKGGDQWGKGGDQWGKGGGDVWGAAPAADAWSKGKGAGAGWDAGKGKSSWGDSGKGFDKGGKGFDKGGKSWGLDAGKGKGAWGGGDGGKAKGKGKKGGSFADKIAQGETLEVGQIKSFQPEKKHGYIVCESIYNQCGQDVYIFQDVMAQSMAGPGDTVAFFIHWSGRGQPQASNPVVRLAAADGAYALKGTFKPGKEGTFGFVSSEEMKELSGRDVYVRAELAAQGFEFGQTVKFNVYLNPQGQPNVDSIEACDPSWVPEASDLSVPRYADVKGGAKGSAKGAKGWGDDGWGGCGKGGKSKGGGGGPPTATGRICFGTVKSWNEANNYGFIECEEVKNEYGNDVFVHGRNFENLTLSVGMCLQFEVAVSAKGQPQALNVQPVDDASAAALSEADISAAAAALEPDAKRARTDDGNTASAESNNTWAAATDAVEWAKQAMLA